jgi:hypothetical protein
MTHPADPVEPTPIETLYADLERFSVKQKGTPTSAAQTMVQMIRVAMPKIIAEARASAEKPAVLLSDVTFVPSEPYPAPGWPVLQGLRCSTCGHALTVPVFHPGQSKITDHKPTLDLTESEEIQWPAPKITRRPVANTALTRADQPAQTAGVTRFEVIDHRAEGQGRILVAWPSRISLSYQDDGRTLKVFVADPRRALDEANRG